MWGSVAEYPGCSGVAEENWRVVEEREEYLVVTVFCNLCKRKKG